MTAPRRDLAWQLAEVLDGYDHGDPVVSLVGALQAVLDAHGVEIEPTAGGAS